MTETIEQYERLKEAKMAKMQKFFARHNKVIQAWEKLEEEYMELQESQHRFVLKLQWESRRCSHEGKYTTIKDDKGVEVCCKCRLPLPIDKTKLPL